MSSFLILSNMHFSAKIGEKSKLNYIEKKNSKYKKEKEANRANSFILVVSDNGVGIPENLDIKNVDSLGIQLITTLADQLDGEFELKRNNGTEFTMRFTVIDKR